MYAGLRRNPIASEKAAAALGEIMVNVRQSSHANTDVGIQRLLEGNHRFFTGRPLHPNQTLDAVAKVAAGQHPFAVVLGCSDSRVPPEIVFDQGLGDLYVSRIAGPIVDDAVQGSIELAVVHLGVRLIVVLGHEQCAAVEAAVRALHPAVVTGAPAIWTWQSGWMPVRRGPAGRPSSIVKAIIPAVEKARVGPGPLLERAVHANIALVVEQVRASAPVLAAGDGIRVVGGYYSLHTGRVQLMVT